MSEPSFLEILGAATLAGMVTLLLVSLAAPALADVQRGNLNSMIEECNQEYGPGEWVAVPANGSERGLYTGQMAVCVSKDSPRAENCDRAWIFGCDPPKEQLSDNQAKLADGGFTSLVEPGKEGGQ